MSRPLSLTTDPIPQLLWRITIPASVGMFFNTMFNFVDTYCAGLLNTDALAGLSLSFPVFFALIGLGSGFMQGTIALLANALGAGDRAEARRVFAQSIVFVIALGLSIAGVRLHRKSARREAAGRGRGLDIGEHQRANLVTHFDRRDHLP
jgi:Na+-driven multidrug efflux pump